MDAARASRRAQRPDRQLLRECPAGRASLRRAAVLGLLTAALVVAQAVLLAHVIATAAVDRAELRQLEPQLLALVAVFAGRAVVAGAMETSGRLGAARAMTELRGRLVSHLLRAERGARPVERTGELASAAVQGVDALEAYFAGYLPQLVLAAAVPVATLAWIVRTDPIVAAILAATIPILIGFMILVGLGARARARSRWRALGLLGGHFLDVVRGLATLRAHRREGVQAQAMERVGDAYRRETMGTLRVAFLSALVLELCAMVGTALAAAAVGIQLDGGYLSLQAGLTVLLLAPELYGPLRAVGQQFHASADATAAAERIFALVDEPTAPVMRAGRRRVHVPDPAIAPLRLEGVSFAHPGRERLVLDGLDLELAPRAVTALTGASGAGKSTLASLVLGLARPNGGRLTCDGVDLRDLDPAAWHRRIAWVPQRPRLLAGSLADNIALAATGASRERIAAAAEQAGLGTLLGELPEGLDTRIGDGGRPVSAGEGQRIGLARALLSDAPLLVLDEPTAHLDRETGSVIVAAVARLAGRRTVLAVTHDPALAAVADRVAHLAGGRILAGGPAAVAA